MFRRIETLEKFWTVFCVVTGSEFLINEDDEFSMRDSCSSASGNCSEALGGAELFEDIRDTVDPCECSEMVISDTFELIF